MKKSLMCILFSCLIVFMPVLAFAKDTPISAIVEPTYFVTIPKTAQLDETIKITANNILTEADKVVKVAITGTNQPGNTFAVSTMDGICVGYKILKDDGNVVALNDAWYFEMDGSVALTLTKISADQVYVGVYKGTVTFTISYENSISHT